MPAPLVFYELKNVLTILHSSIIDKPTFEVYNYHVCKLLRNKGVYYEMDVTKRT